MPLVSVADQTVEQMGGEGSILRRQQRDHQALEELMSRYEAGVAPAGRPGLVRDICRLALQHAFAEETVLFPAARKVLPDGDPLTAEIETEHQRINELLDSLASLSPADPEYDGRVREAIRILRQDARDEEDRLLPRLQQLWDADRLLEVGAAWEASKQTAPTRPHPAISRRPPGNLLAGVPLSLWDRARDVAGLLAARVRAVRGRSRR